MDKDTPIVRARQVELVITASVAADHEQRGVFRELRPENASAINYGAPGRSMYKVSRLMAATVLADAWSRYRTRDKSRGLSVAYTTLIDKICRSCGWSRAWYDPLNELPEFHEMMLVQPIVSSLLERLRIPSAVVEGMA